jgi:hypothetical protein
MACGMSALRQRQSFANRMLWNAGSTYTLVLLFLANFLNSSSSFCYSSRRSR